MKTLIIPCCGKNRLCGLPIWMNRYPDGKYLLEKCIESMYSNEFDFIFITVLKSDVIKFGGNIALERVKSIFPVRIYMLDRDTRDQAETIYLTIKDNLIEGEIMIRDSDVDFQVPKLNHRNFILGANLMQLDQPIIDLKNKSFCSINEQNIILDIMDKRIKSENICIGLFGLKNASDFISAYQRLRNSDYSIGNLYVSSIIAYLIGIHKGIFHYFEVNAFEPWDNEGWWSQIRNEQGCYLISYCEEMDERFMKEIKQWQDKGAKIIMLFSEHKEFCKEKIEYLESFSIFPMQNVFGCGYGEKKLI